MYIYIYIYIEREREREREREPRHSGETVWTSRDASHSRRAPGMTFHPEASDCPSVKCSAPGEMIPVSVKKTLLLRGGPDKLLAFKTPNQGLDSSFCCCVAGQRLA